MAQHEQAIIKDERQKLGQHVALCVEEQSLHALAGSKIADICRRDGVEVADAVRAGECEYRPEIRIHQRRAFPRSAIFGDWIAETRRQAHPKIFRELRAFGTLCRGQRSFQARNFLRFWFAHQASLTEEPARAVEALELV